LLAGRAAVELYYPVYPAIYVIRENGMGVPLMLQEADARRIEALKKRLGARTKVEVVRTALDALEREANRVERVERWKRAVALAGSESRRVNRAFQKHSRLKRIG
jgi:hypothetical protein